MSIPSSLPSTTRDQVEAEDRITAGTDASNRVVANLLRDDSAGRADSASAALGSVAGLGWLIYRFAMTPQMGVSMQPRGCCNPKLVPSGDHSASGALERSRDAIT